MNQDTNSIEKMTLKHLKILDLDLDLELDLPVHWASHTTLYGNSQN